MDLRIDNLTELTLVERRNIITQLLNDFKSSRSLLSLNNITNILNACVSIVDQENITLLDTLISSMTIDESLLVKMNARNLAKYPYYFSHIQYQEIKIKLLVKILGDLNLSLNTILLLYFNRSGYIREFAIKQLSNFDNRAKYIIYTAAISDYISSTAKIASNHLEKLFTSQNTDLILLLMNSYALVSYSKYNYISRFKELVTMHLLTCDYLELLSVYNTTPSFKLKSNILKMIIERNSPDSIRFMLRINDIPPKMVRRFTQYMQNNLSKSDYYNHISGNNRYIFKLLCGRFYHENRYKYQKEAKILALSKYPFYHLTKAAIKEENRYSYEDFMSAYNNLGYTSLLLSACLSTEDQSNLEYLLKTGPQKVKIPAFNRLTNYKKLTPESYKYALETLSKRNLIQLSKTLKNNSIYMSIVDVETVYCRYPNIAVKLSRRLTLWDQLSFFISITTQENKQLIDELMVHFINRLNKGAYPLSTEKQDSLLRLYNKKSHLISNNIINILIKHHDVIYEFSKIKKSDFYSLSLFDQDHDTNTFTPLGDIKKLYRLYTKKKDYAWLTIKSEEELIGDIMYQVKNTCIYPMFRINPKHQNKGNIYPIFRLFLAYLNELDKNFSNIIIGISKNNTRALKAFIAIGFNYIHEKDGFNYYSYTLSE